MTSTDGTRLRGEEAIIHEYLAPLAAGYPGAFGLTDDCAAFTPTPGHDLVVKTDPVAAGVHFFPDDDPADIGWKALAVNVSDLAAKGAEPRAYLMALSFPEAPTRDWMQRFASGLAEAQAAFGMHLIGGDTDRRPGPLSITITVFGEVPTGAMVRRATARPGDRIYVSGTLGAAATGFALIGDLALAAKWGLSEAEAMEVVRRFHRPEPRLSLRAALLGHARAAMDLSDGLAKDLGRMCKASACGARVRLGAIPMLSATAKALGKDASHATAIVASGDDYEILVSVPADRGDAFEAAVASSAGGLKVTHIGEMTDGPGVEILGSDGAPLVLGKTGWDHF